MSTEDSKRNRTKLLVLLALGNGDMHGYEISKFSEQIQNFPVSSLTRLELAFEAAQSLTLPKSYSSVRAP